MLTGLGIHDWTWNIPNIYGERLDLFSYVGVDNFDGAWFGEWIHYA